MGTGKVEVVPIGSHVTGPPFNDPTNPNGNPAYLATQEYGGMPFGVYWFVFGFVHGTAPQNAHGFISSVTGMGLQWTKVKDVRVNIASLVDTIIVVWQAVGTPQRGNIVVEAKSIALAAGGTEADGPYQFTDINEWAYALYRIKNAPTSPVVQETGGSTTVTTPPGQPITFPNAIGDPRNAIFAVMVHPSRRIFPVWPMVIDWDDRDENGHIEAKGVVLSAYPAKTTYWLSDSSSVGTNIWLWELGYRKKPWLRQRQRTDNPR